MNGTVEMSLQSWMQQTIKLMITWKAVEESDKKKAVRNGYSVLEEGDGERKSFFYLQVMWKWFSFLPPWTWIITDSHMGNGKQHGERSAHSKSPPGTTQRTCLNSLNLTLVLFCVFPKTRKEDVRGVRWCPFVFLPFTRKTDRKVTNLRRCRRIYFNPYSIVHKFRECRCLTLLHRYFVFHSSFNSNWLRLAHPEINTAFLIASIIETRWHMNEQQQSETTIQMCSSLLVDPRQQLVSNLLTEVCF